MSKRLSPQEINKIISSIIEEFPINAQKLLSHIEALEEEIKEQVILVKTALDDRGKAFDKCERLRKALKKISYLSSRSERNIDDYGEIAREALK